MPLTLEQYASYLDTRDLPWPVVPPVELPKARPHLVRLKGVRAVTWSVYGTLLAIPGGELYYEHPQKILMDLALDKVLQEFKMWGSMSRKPGQPAAYLGQMYAQVLFEQKAAVVPGERYPEVIAERVWEGIVKKLLQKDYKFDAGFYGSLNEFSRKVAYFFHASLQGTAAYPGAADALAHVAGLGLAQGLLADGQSFTLVQLRRGLSRQRDGAAVEDYFDPELLVLSNAVRGRKPSERLFRHLLERLEERGLAPGEVLHVGSHVAHDVVPARRLGMRTGLFAGDRASLHATADQLREGPSRPDVLLTELGQIAEVVGGS